MAPTKTSRVQCVLPPAMALGMVLAPLTGCDSSSAVKEVPEQAQKALIQRKVDVSPGQAKSSRTGGPPTKNRASGR